MYTPEDTKPTAWPKADLPAPSDKTVPCPRAQAQRTNSYTIGQKKCKQFLASVRNMGLNTQTGTVQQRAEERERSRKRIQRGQVLWPLNGCIKNSLIGGCPLCQLWRTAYLMNNPSPLPCQTFLCKNVLFCPSPTCSPCFRRPIAPVLPVAGAASSRMEVFSIDNPVPLPVLCRGPSPAGRGQAESHVGAPWRVPIPIKLRSASKEESDEARMVSGSGNGPGWHQRRVCAL